jgi:SynChlorMet cassette protein ScmC
MIENYCLELTGSRGWNIVATKGSALWVDKFARILHLRECRPERYPKLIIKRKHESQSSCGEIVRESRYVKFFYKRDGCPDIICLIGDEEDHVKEFYKMWDLLLPVYERVKQEGGMPFHAALLEKGGKGVLLSAEGGTGKSTCVRRVPSTWRTLSDDECLIVRDGQNGYMVHPLPTWSDYLLERSSRVWDVRQAVSLSGIFFLKQAETDEAILLGKGEASMRAYDSGRQVCQYGRIMKEKEEERAGNIRMLDNAARLVQTVPSYVLNFSLTGSFWEEIEKVL